MFTDTEPRQRRALSAQTDAAVDGPPPLVLHLIPRRGGALEQEVINLINLMPPERYRHAIVCLGGHEELRGRICAPGVEIVSLKRRDGMDWRHYLRLFQTFRRLRPTLLHSRDRSGLEGQLIGAAAGIRLRLHAEHGPELDGMDRPQRKHQLLGKLLRPLIGRYVAVSCELESWLVDSIGAAPARVSRIGNGVDSLHFHPRLGPVAALGPPGFLRDDVFVIGSVGRMDEGHDSGALVQAFLMLLARADLPRRRLRLMIVGDGPGRAACRQLLERAGAADLAWLPGRRDDIAQLMRTMDLYVQPSPAAGSSRAILEAMASGLPVVATEVGAHGELVRAGWTGALVPPRQPARLAEAMAGYCRAPGLAARHGARARRRVLSDYSLAAMADAYLAVYDGLTSGSARTGPSPHPPYPH